MTEEVILHVDDKDVPIEIEPLTDLEKMKWMSEAPNIHTDVDKGTPEGMVPYLVALTKSQTLLTDELLNELPQDQLGKLFKAVVEVAFDIEAGTEDDDDFGLETQDDSFRGFQ